MANLIKVNQVVIKRGEGRSNYKDYSQTAKNVLAEVFGADVPLGLTEWQGIEFHAIHADAGWSSYGANLKGIQMAVGDYGNKTIRRVLVTKDSMIDADALRIKFGELKVLADEYEQVRQSSQDYQTKSQEALTRIARAAGPPKADWDMAIRLEAKSPTSVTMRAKVDGFQLVSLSKLLGAPITVELKVEVPEDKAVEAYHILLGGK